MEDLSFLIEDVTFIASLQAVDWPLVIVSTGYVLTKSFSEKVNLCACFIVWGINSSISILHRAKTL